MLASQTMITAQSVFDSRSASARTRSLRTSFCFDAYVGMLRTLAYQGHRPNLLVVVGRGLQTEATARKMVTLGVLPFHWCSLPGRLLLPTTKTGTLFLNDVAALSRDQQLALFDWLGKDSERLQTISITSVALESLVEDGQFLEALYYRLNVVRLDVTRYDA